MPMSRIVLCSADAGPASQHNAPRPANYFFPGAHWVGAVRNAANNLGVRFVILTTGHGLVNPNDILSPYDYHIDTYRPYITEKWQQTIPALLSGNGFELLVFYAGGCPRDAYLDIALPLFLSVGLSVVTFGQPQMADSGNLGNIVSAINLGAEVDELKAVLNFPERFKYFPAIE